MLSASTATALGELQVGIEGWGATVPQPSNHAGGEWRAVLQAGAADLDARTGRLLATFPSSGAGADAPALRARLTDLRSLLADIVASKALTPQAATLLSDELAGRLADLRTRLSRAELQRPPAGSAAGAAEAVDSALFEARLALASGERARAAEFVATSARRARRLDPMLETLPTTRRSIDSALLDAARAAQTGDTPALARARGTVKGELVTAAYRLTLDAVARRDLDAARQWIAARDLGPSAGARRVPDQALRAVDELAAGRIDVASATLAIQRDQLDVFQRRTVALVQEAGRDAYLGADADRAEAGALAAAYWKIIAPAGERSLGAKAVSKGSASLAALATLPAGTTGWKIDAAVTASNSALTGFTAAPLSARDRSARVERLIRLAQFQSSQLCGTTNGPTAEPSEAAAVVPALAQLGSDLGPGLAPAARARLERALASLAQLPSAAGTTGEDIPAPASVAPGATRLCASAEADLRAVFPKEWRSVGAGADFDQVNRELATMVAAARQGDYNGAEAARVRAYAAFEFGAELRMRAFDPTSASRIEGLFWAGAADGPDLVTLLAHRAPSDRVERRRDDLQDALEHGRIALQRGDSSAAAVINSAIVVFREGLEAALVLAALSASFAVGGSRWRRPLIGGMLAAIPATVLTWFLTSVALESFSHYGLQLEAALDLAAFVVLGIIMAWFFQRFCWTRFVASTHGRQKRIVRRTAVARFASANVALGILGFTIFYREGFETVVYLQALKLGAGGSTVLQGVVLGIAATAALAVLMFRLRRRLPYRGIVVATAIAIGVLLVIMAGQGARAFQAAGWLSITPVDWPIPMWAGQWLGVYPSLETLLIQLLTAIAIPIGSELFRRRRNRRQTRRMAQARARKTRPKAPAAAADSRSPVAS